MLIQSGWLSGGENNIYFVHSSSWRCKHWKEFFPGTGSNREITQHTNRQARDRRRWLFFLSFDSHDNKKANDRQQHSKHSKSLQVAVLLERARAQRAVAESSPEQPWDYSMPPLYKTTSFDVKPLCSVSEIIFKQIPIERVRTGDYATLHVTNLIRQGLFDGKLRHHRDSLYWSRLKKDMLGCLATPLCALLPMLPHVSYLIRQHFDIYISICSWGIITLDVCEMWKNWVLLEKVHQIISDYASNF